jgi:hypothetical protein
MAINLNIIPPQLPAGDYLAHVTDVNIIELTKAKDIAVFRLEVMTTEGLKSSAYLPFKTRHIWEQKLRNKLRAQGEPAWPLTETDANKIGAQLKKLNGLTIRISYRGFYLIPDCEIVDPQL